MIKARVIRYLFALHRWMGVTLGLLMLLWCLTGVVMIWQPYPSTTLGDRDRRLEGLALIRAPETYVLPDLPVTATLTAARIEMLAGRPVIAVGWSEDGAPRRGLYDLASGAAIEGISEADALSVARTYLARHKLKGEPAVNGRIERDAFVVAGYFNAQRPFYQVALNDANGTELYVSAKTGAVAQLTTASSRFWSWLGPIPHWLYFTELRKDTQLWTQVIIWTSLGGCFLTALGLFVGVRQFRRRRSTGKLDSPYRGAKFWHHMTGLLFGVLVLTFTFSGFASMQPWGWLDTGPKAAEAADRYAGKPLTWSDARPALEAQMVALRTISRERSLVSFLQLEGKPWFIWQAADGSRRRFDAAGQPSPFDARAEAEAAQALAGEGARAERLTSGDDYYYPGASSSDLPVVRVTARDDTRFYLDPDTGAVRFIADDGAKGFRWWHLALHTFDVLSSPVREIVLVLVMLGVSAVCGFGVWLGAGKLARGGRLDNAPEAKSS